MATEKPSWAVTESAGDDLKTAEEKEEIARASVPSYMSIQGRMEPRETMRSRSNSIEPPRKGAYPRGTSVNDARASNGRLLSAFDANLDGRGVSSVFGASVRSRGVDHTGGLYTRHTEAMDPRRYDHERMEPDALKSIKSITPGFQSPACRFRAARVQASVDSLESSGGPGIQARLESAEYSTTE